MRVLPERPASARIRWSVAGSSLLEVLVALAISATLLIAALQMIRVSIKTQGDVVFQTKAVFLAGDRFSRISAFRQEDPDDGGCYFRMNPDNPLCREQTLRLANDKHLNYVRLTIFPGECENREMMFQRIVFREMN
jgi:hypothetical protein